MLIDEERTWAGSESSLKAVLEADAKLATQAMSPQEDDDEDDTQRLLAVEDGVATITIHGPLVNSDSPWLEYFGLTGYGEAWPK